LQILSAAHALRSGDMPTRPALSRCRACDMCQLCHAAIRS
jgi:hypothetical protein